MTFVFDFLVLAVLFTVAWHIAAEQFERRQRAPVGLYVHDLPCRCVPPRCMVDSDHRILKVPAEVVACFDDGFLHDGRTNFPYQKENA
ncbi:MAG TPA: hypothetical protein VKU02_18955 [Gemmataceae bacterium]|nr:hypothetical protein [Gemmataceae bacterium]